MYKAEALLLCCVPVCLLLAGQASANISSCVRNCGQCKSMYGRFFQGTACADSCLAGNDGPDCHDLSMVSRFLKRSSVPVAAETPLGGGYEYYSVDGQPDAGRAGAVIRLLAARSAEVRK